MREHRKKKLTFNKHGGSMRVRTELDTSGVKGSVKTPRKARTAKKQPGLFDGPVSSLHRE